MTRAAVAVLWERIEPILDAALELPQNSWPSYLDRACEGNAALRAAVERLLVSAEGTETADEARAVVWAQPLFLEREPPPPSRIGPYLIDRALARGGMGTVYLASREGADPAHQVALKVMRSGLDQDRVLRRRFTEERQILAALEHPGIARLLEGGVNADGHPWFAMEYVDGVPLDLFVAANALTIAERLGLFLQVADAVAYAHRNLIVHRDLKPSNILVAADGTVKLLDFGIAKLLAPSVAGEAPITRTGFQPFTPEYASPEQVLGEPVTTAADVYALGVVLYELLTGERPLALARTNPADWARIVRESEPKAPSAAAADGRPLRGDLDTVTLMALRREPDRRYPSVDRLADDVRRYLDKRPVHARADSWLYRSEKFVRRHRVAVAAAVIVVFSLAGFAVVAREQNGRIMREAARTAAQRDQASAVTHTLWSLLAKTTDSAGKPLSVAQVLDNAAPIIAEQYQTQPNVRATMQTALGEIYLSNGDQLHAEMLLRQAVASQREYGRDSLDLASHLEALAHILLQAQQYPGAESAAAESRAIHSRLQHDSVDVESSESLASALMNQERYDQAEVVLRELLTVEAAHPPTFGTSAVMLLGEVLRRQGRNEEAVTLFEQEMARLDKLHGGPDSTTVAIVLGSLGAAHGMLGHEATADSMLRQSYSIYHGAGLPERYGRTAMGGVFAARAELAARVGDDARAIPLADSARTLWTGAVPADDYRWATLARVDALILRDRNQTEAAIAHLIRTLDMLRSSPHPNYYAYRRTESTLADVYDRWGLADSAATHRAMARPGGPFESPFVAR
jgi:serine/threonine protein kinase/Tfp pilus assembly protein PilF